MPDVIVSENIRGPAMESLATNLDVLIEADLWQAPDQLVQQLKSARAIIVRNQTQVTAEIIKAAPMLEVIGRAGAGLDNIDVQAATDNGVVVTYAPNENSISVAELTIGLLLSLLRTIPAANQDTRNGGWNRQSYVGGELYGKTLGIIGLGRIGRLTAARAKAFDMRLVAFDEYIDPQIASDEGVELVSLDELLESSDAIVLHVPLTDETRGMMDQSKFQRMKPTAVLVNTSRGEVVNESDLASALEAKQLAGAALDVRETEPPGESTLSSMNNVVLTPHIAAFTKEAQSRVVEAVCRDVAAVLNGGEAANAANFSRPNRG